MKYTERDLKRVNERINAARKAIDGLKKMTSSDRDTFWEALKNDIKFMEEAVDKRISQLLSDNQNDSNQTMMELKYWKGTLDCYKSIILRVDDTQEHIRIFSEQLANLKRDAEKINDYLYAKNGPKQI